MLFPSFDQLQDRHTMKWTRYPHDVLPLWVAESDFSTCPAVMRALEQQVSKERFGYIPDNPGLMEATADFYSRRYGFAAKPEWIFALPDVVRGLYVSILHFTKPGSKVIVALPAYPPFLQLLDATGREGVFIDATDGIDLADVEAGFQEGAGSFILCNPFNPLGMVFGEEFLVKVCDLAAKYEARVLVDEIHAPLVLEGKHTVAAGVSETAAKVCITVTATSKAWNTAGLKCAQIIFSNEDDVQRWLSLSPVIRDGVSTIGLAAAEAAYREGEEFLEEEIAYLRENRDFVFEELPKQIPGAKCGRLDATYLLWVDFRETAIASNPATFFLEEAKVALNDGEWFGPVGKGFCRMNLATSREILAEGIDRMARAVAKLS